jgi:hypothetical protein
MGMPTYERLDTIEGRVECLLQWADEQSAGKFFDIPAAIRHLESAEEWRRANANRMIRAYLEGLESLARAKLNGRMSADQCQRFRVVVAAEDELLQALEARGFRHPDKIRDVAARPWV